MLTRESILGASGLATVDVDVPALGGAVKIRMMTVGQRDAFEIANAKDKGRYFRPRLVVASVIDDAGNLLFAPADIPAIANQPNAAIEPIVDAITKLNRYTPDEIERLEGN